MSVYKWKVYCETEQKYIEGYLEETEGKPTKCFNNNEHSIDTSKSIIIEKILSEFTNVLTKWKIFCDTENIYTYGYSTELPYPERCFNNINHVMSKKPIAIKSITNNESRIKEEFGNTGGYFQSITYKLDCESGETIQDYSYPYPICAFLVSFKTISENKDDFFNIEVGPDSVVGIITNSISSPTNILEVSETVIENCKIGFLVSITDGINIDNLGKIIEIDNFNSTITTTNSTSFNFSSSSPTYVRITVKMVSDFLIGHPGDYTIGSSKIGGSSVPSNTTVRVKYFNNSLSVKEFYINVEILY